MSTPSNFACLISGEGGQFLMHLVTTANFSGRTPLLGHLQNAFKATFQDVPWIVLAYLLAGIALFSVASGLGGVAPTLGLLIAARAVQGLGAAIMMALAVALVGETVPTGSAMGLLGTMSAIGTALGPALGGILVAGFGRRAIFLALVPLGGTGSCYRLPRPPR